jgi:hypothetical protein
MEKDMKYLEHLKERAGSDLTPLLKWVDYPNELLTFPLWNVSGQLVGYQQYNWKGEKKARNNRDGKYWTYTPKDTIAVWGLEYVDLVSNEPLYLVEGIWDAWSVKELGKLCVAVLCNNPQNIKTWLNTLPCKTIAICEGDKAGRMLARVADTAIYLPEGQDPNSMTTKELIECINSY